MSQCQQLTDAKQWAHKELGSSGIEKKQIKLQSKNERFINHVLPGGSAPAMHL